ncbi:hypothetical protein SDC9_210158 [bioreactor metagenome]|uniref:Uncharacterized protein n=1 Tax=bioreactor metagenome TaxID=1076179 RepID=A0A645JFM8_9ZZZZ
MLIEGVGAAVHILAEVVRAAESVVKRHLAYSALNDDFTRQAA